MDAWMSYIRTRESILSKHYTEESLFLSASRGHAKSRSLTDSLISALRPLSKIGFHLDLLYETRLLHESLLQLAVSTILTFIYIWMITTNEKVKFILIDISNILEITFVTIWKFRNNHRFAAVEKNCSVHQKWSKWGKCFQRWTLSGAWWVLSKLVLNK